MTTNNMISLFDFSCNTIIDNIHSSNTAAIEKLPLPTILINQLKPLFLKQLIYKDLCQRSIKFNYKSIPKITQHNYKSINVDMFFSTGLAQLTRKFTYRSDIAKLYGTINRTVFIKKLCMYIENINTNKNIKKVIAVKLIQNYNLTKGLYADILSEVINIALSFSKTNISTADQLLALENLIFITGDKSNNKKFRICLLCINFKAEIHKNRPTKLTIEDYNKILKAKVICSK